MEDKKKLLKDSLEELEIPESLLPENIEKKLEEADKQVAFKKKPTRKWKRAVIAASFGLVVLLGISIPQVIKTGETDVTESAMETAMESTDGASAPETESYDIDGVLHTAKDYDEITDILEKAKKEYKRQQLDGTIRGFFEGDVVYETAVTEDAVEDSAAKTSGADYSNTNVRTEGVDEGDIVKIDGNYIYQRYPADEVRVIRINDGKMEEVSTISLDDDGSGFIHEIYLDGDKMMIVYDWTKTEMKNGKKGVLDYSYADTSYSVCVATYDISDKTAPKKCGVITVDGTYYSSRYSDGHVYVMTTFGQPIFYYCYDETYNDLETEDLIPRVNEELIGAQDILLPDETKNEPFFVVTSCDTNHPSKVVDTKAVMGYVDQVYVSTDAIYFYSNEYTESGYNETTIVKFAYEKGQVIPKTATTVRGSIDDSFCIDEDAKGYLRVAVTAQNENWEMESSLYVFDKNLKQTGSIKDFAGNEGIKSCRFMGDVGYIVTFRNTDPLFALDLSDPREPKIVSELTLPGFSEYLHSWSDDLLFGMGYVADEETGRVGNVKLSMFDVSDLKNTNEITTKVLDLTQADVLWGDYKSLLISPSKNIIGFFGCNGHWNENDEWCNDAYYKVYEYNYADGEFREMLSVETGDAYASDVRGLFSGNYLYIIDGKAIASYDMITYDKVAELGD